MDRIKNAPRTVFVSRAVGPILTWAAFWPVLHNGFVNYDDPEYVTENPHVQTGLTAANVRWALTSQHGGNWHRDVGFAHVGCAVVWVAVELAPRCEPAVSHAQCDAVVHPAGGNDGADVAQRVRGGTVRSAPVACGIGRLDCRAKGCVERVLWIIIVVCAYASSLTGKSEARNSKLETSPKSEIRNKIIYYAVALIFLRWDCWRSRCW